MRFLKKYWVWIIASLLVGLFWWTRLNNISESLMFFNDMGRDMLVLQQWKMTGKIPLLGPQTSALPINQSAIYFYLLYPLFLLTQGHPVSELYTATLVYILLFLGGLYLLRKSRELSLALLIVFFLATIHPQYIIQGRFIWNPSFVSPFLIMGLVGYLLFIKNHSKLMAAVAAAGLAMAVSLSYSVAPVILAVLILAIWTKRQKALSLLIWFAISLMLLNAGTLVFEVRHHFQLTGMLLSRGASVQVAENITLQAKLASLASYGVASGTAWLDRIGLVVIMAISLWSYKKGGNNRVVASIFLLTLTINLVVPLTIHSHYIFGFTCLAFLMLAVGRQWLLLAVITVVYSVKIWNGQYFQTAIRTYQQIDSCIEMMCQQIKEPVFGAVQAGYHPYHNGPEFRFLMLKNGCNLRSIEEKPESAKLMAVILDQSSFELGRTSFNELSMFGKAQEKKRLNCQGNMGVVILEKATQ